MVRSVGRWVVPFLASLVVCSLVASAVAAGVAAGAPADVSAGSQPAIEPASAVAQEGFDVDRTVFEITVFEDGSAEWTFRYETALSDDDERTDFETFADEFNSEETETFANFRDRASALTAAGGEATGREMTAGAFDRRAYTDGLEDDLGVVEMSFRWGGFAEIEEGVVVGDVFEGGLYLSADQRLVVRPGPGLAFADVQPDDGQLSHDSLAESTSVTWDGERSFTDTRPRIVFAPEGDVAAETPTMAVDGASSPLGGPLGWVLTASAVVVIAAGAGVAVAYRSGRLPALERAVAGVTDGATATSSSDAREEGTEVDAGTTVTEADLISDEERVVTLLEDNGGRMKQVKIVEETGWSKSKVSMLLSDMEETGTISKLRVGRENIVSLAGHEPDAAGSPFDDER